MHLIFALMGCVFALALAAAGLIYVFAPGTAERFLKDVLASLGMIFGGVILVSELFATHPIATFLAIPLASAVAFVIREHRGQQVQRPQGLRGVERKPIVPQAQFRG